LAVFGRALTILVFVNILPLIYKVMANSGERCFAPFNGGKALHKCFALTQSIDPAPGMRSFIPVFSGVPFV
jgi:hypothetical protein